MTKVTFLDQATMGLYLAFKEHFDGIAGLTDIMLQDTDLKAEFIRSLKASHELAIRTISETESVNREVETRSLRGT